MKSEIFVVSLSGGKDSSAMLLRLLEENRPVDLILYCDTGWNFHRCTTTSTDWKPAPAERLCV